MSLKGTSMAQKNCGTADTINLLHIVAWLILGETQKKITYLQQEIMIVEVKNVIVLLYCWRLCVTDTKTKYSKKECYSKKKTKY